MPLPVSAQTYIPNPLLGVQASQAGQEYGQNLIEGPIKAAGGALDLVKTGQDIYYRPDEEQRKQQALDIKQQQEQDQADYRNKELDIRNTAEERQARAEQYNEKYKDRSLDINSRRADIYQESVNIQAMREKRLSNDAAKGDEYSAAANNYVSTGNLSGLTPYADGSDPAGQLRQSKFMSWAHSPKNIHVVDALRDRLQEDIANNQFEDLQEHEAAQNLYKALSYGTKLNAQGKLAEQTAGYFREQFNVDLDPNLHIGFDPREGVDPKTGNFNPMTPRHVYQFEPGSKEPAKLIGAFTPSTPKELNDLNKYIGGWNWRLQIKGDQQKEFEKQVQAAADRKQAIQQKRSQTLNQGLEDGGGDVNIERPTKDTPVSRQQTLHTSSGTPSTRLGLERRPPTPEEADNNVRQTQEQLRTEEQKRKARLSARQVVKPGEVPENLMERDPKTVAGQSPFPYLGIR